MSAVLKKEELESLAEARAVCLQMDSLLRSRGVRRLPEWTKELGPNLVAEVAMSGIDVRGVDTDRGARVVLKAYLADKEKELEAYRDEFGVIAMFIAKLIFFRAWLEFKEFKRIVEDL